jgi:DnaJ domain
MLALLFGLVGLLVALMAAQTFLRASPAVMSRWVKLGSAAFLMGVGGFLVVRGLYGVGAGLVATGAWVLVGRFPAWRSGGMTSGSPPRASRVTTDHLDVELEHDSGVMRGQVIKGFFKGRDLEALKPVELAHLWSDCRFVDPQSAHILEAFLDRVHPSWRADMAAADGGAAGGDDAGTGMSVDEARDILGVAVGATDEDVRRAHRELMLKLHPDRGGSHTLATLANAAKAVLLDRASH